MASLLAKKSRLCVKKPMKKNSKIYEIYDVLKKAKGTLK